MSVYGAVETVLRDRRDSGGKALVPYITGGLGDDWVATVQAVAAAGADVIEIGIPFSDPVMDGPTIQAANERALGAGATPTSILDALRGLDVGVPLIAGPRYANFTDVYAEFEAAAALDIVKKPKELGRQVAALLSNPLEAAEKGSAARAIVSRQSSALDDLTELLQAKLFG